MLSMRAKYALKALIYLAKAKDQGPVLIGDIAGSQKLPRKFLEQILLELKNLRVLKSRQGKGGDADKDAEVGESFHAHGKKKVGWEWFGNQKIIIFVRISARLDWGEPCVLSQ